MKKFEMPVVVLNEMTMNESIASDCCYKQVTEGYVTTKTVLNGGSISDYVTYPLKTIVANRYGNRAALPSYHYNLYTVLAGNTVIPDTTVSGVTWPVEGTVSGGITAANFKNLGSVLYFQAGTYEIGESEIHGLTQVGLVDGSVYSGLTGDNNLTGAYLLRKGGTCDHMNSDCPFVTKSTLSNAHIGSTMKHLFGGSDWSTPHTAQQYNS